MPSPVFSCEERLENAVQKVFIHPVAGIRNHQQHIRAWLGLQAAPAVFSSIHRTFLVSKINFRLPHCVRGIDRQIQDNLLDLRRVRIYGVEINPQGEALFLSFWE